MSLDCVISLWTARVQCSERGLCDRSLDCAGSVRFCNSLMMSVNQCRNLGCGDDFVTCTLEFISRLRNIAIDSTEFCILCAIVLTYPGLSIAAVRLIFRPHHSTTYVDAA